MVVFSTALATVQAIFFGLGSDGTVGANKAAAAIIGERTEFYSQATVFFLGETMMFFFGMPV